MKLYHCPQTIRKLSPFGYAGGSRGEGLSGDQVHERAIVALHDGHPVELQLLYPDLGIEAPIAAVAERYDLDRGALEAAARSALAVPDRVVVLDVLAPAA